MVLQGETDEDSSINAEQLVMGVSRLKGAARTWVLLDILGWSVGCYVFFDANYRCGCCCYGTLWLLKLS